MRNYNQIREKEIEAETARLQAEIEKCDKEISEIKLERQDM